MNGLQGYTYFFILSSNCSGRKLNQNIKWKYLVYDMLNPAVEKHKSETETIICSEKDFKEYCQRNILKHTT